MTDRKYIVGSGYHDTGNGQVTMFARWIRNVYTHSTPAKVFVIGDSGAKRPLETYSDIIEFDKFELFNFIPIDNDLGYCGQLLSGEKKHRFPTGPMVLVTLAMLAYMNECDLVYLEQDALMFGDCVGEMYKALGDGGICFGNCKFVPAANSLFLLKHHFIPEFVSLYMSSPAENHPDQICEAKFHQFEKADPKNWKRYAFHCDRDRPIPYDAPTFSGQKFTADELTELEKRSLI